MLPVPELCKHFSVLPGCSLALEAPCCATTFAATPLLSGVTRWSHASQRKIQVVPGVIDDWWKGSEGIHLIWSLSIQTGLARLVSVPRSQVFFVHEWIFLGNLASETSATDCKMRSAPSRFPACFDSGHTQPG